MKLLIDVNYSAQAQAIMNEFKDFNKAEFEQSCLRDFTVGDKMIYEYILRKALQKKVITNG